MQLSLRRQYYGERNATRIFGLVVKNATLVLLLFLFDVVVVHAERCTRVLPQSFVIHSLFFLNINIFIFSPPLF